MQSKKDNCLQVRATIRGNNLWPFQQIERIRVMPHLSENLPIIGGRTIKVVAFASLSSFSLQMNKAGSWPMFESLKKSIMTAAKKNKD